MAHVGAPYSISQAPPVIASPNHSVIAVRSSVCAANVADRMISFEGDQQAHLKWARNINRCHDLLVHDLGESFGSSPGAYAAVEPAHLRDERLNLRPAQQLRGDLTVVRAARDRSSACATASGSRVPAILFAVTTEGALDGYPTPAAIP